MLSIDDLVRMFVDIISKNGNLLLNVGPMADGTIPDLQKERLEGLGAWLAVNAESVFGTRPWQVAEGETREGISVRFTQKPGILYAILLAMPGNAAITIKNLCAGPGMTAKLLGHESHLAWRQSDDGLTINLPESGRSTP